MSCTFLAILAACSPLKIGYPDESEGMVEPVDSGSPDSATTVDSGLAPCQDETWPDTAVTVLDSCTLPVAEFELVELWSTADPGLVGVSTLAAGRFEDADGSGDIGPADPVLLLAMPHGTSSSSTSGPTLLDGDGDVMSTVLEFNGAHRCYATVGDLDGTRSGMEAFLGWYWHASNAEVGGMDEFGLVWRAGLDESSLDGYPWLLDLEADGVPEVLWGGAVRDPLTGEILVELDGASDDGQAVAADLDLDGLPEIIASTTQDDVVIWNVAGERLASFAGFSFDYGPALFAVGNLDGDEQGEVVVSSYGQLSIIELDGTVRATTESGSSTGALMGLAELDGDELPEIVIDYNGGSAKDGAGIAAYDSDLSPLWRRTASHQSWSPFAVADLDADGLHELVVRDGQTLLILDASGELLGWTESPQVGGYMSTPLVADIDGDDLAEIAVASNEGWMAVYESPTGGWAVRGADRPWPGLDHFPGDREYDGSLPAAGDAHWLRPGENVWQGLAAGAPDLPDLGLELAERCVQPDGGTRFTVYVANHGPADLEEPVQLRLSLAADGSELARAESPSCIPSGSASALQLEVALEDPQAALIFSVDDDERVAECAELGNSLSWSADKGRGP